MKDLISRAHTILSMIGVGMMLVFAAYVTVRIFIETTLED